MVSKSIESYGIQAVELNVAFLITKAYTYAPLKERIIQNLKPKLASEYAVLHLLSLMKEWLKRVSARSATCVLAKPSSHGTPLQVSYKTSVSFFVRS